MTVMYEHDDLYSHLFYYNRHSPSFFIHVEPNVLKSVPDATIKIKRQTILESTTDKSPQGTEKDDDLDTIRRTLRSRLAKGVQDRCQGRRKPFDKLRLPVATANILLFLNSFQRQSPNKGSIFSSH